MLWSIHISVRLFHKRHSESSNVLDDSHQHCLISQQTPFLSSWIWFQGQKSMRKEPQGYCAWFYVKHTDIPSISDKANHKMARLDKKTLPFEITLDCYLFGMHHWQWVIGQSSWNFSILLWMQALFIFPWSNLVVSRALEKARKFSARMENSLISPTPQVQSPNVV